MYFHFIALQSESAVKELPKDYIMNQTPDSLVLLDKGNYYRYSTAALRIARKLSFPWNLLYVLIIIPPFIRDPLYKWLASKRYLWFGRKEQCFIFDDKYKSRFI